MKDFREWLNEGRRFAAKSAPGGAFGNRANKRPQPPKIQQPQQQPEDETVPNTADPRAIGAYTHSREDQRTLRNYDQRVAFGLTQEQKILAAAKECGMNIFPSTKNEDKFLKIDGWWEIAPGNRVPIQVKYRDTGNDILFEVIKPFVKMPIISNYNRLGRDVKPAGQPATEYNSSAKTGAQYILHLNPTGNTLTVIESKPCYDIILKMIQTVDTQGWANQQRRVLVTSSGVLRWQRDGASGVEKIMAYIPINVVGAVKQCNVNIKIE